MSEWVGGWGGRHTLKRVAWGYSHQVGLIPKYQQRSSLILFHEVNNENKKRGLGGVEWCTPEAAALHIATRCVSGRRPFLGYAFETGDMNPPTTWYPSVLMWSLPLSILLLIIYPPSPILCLRRIHTKQSQMHMSDGVEGSSSNKGNRFSY